MRPGLRSKCTAIHAHDAADMPDESDKLIETCQERLRQAARDASSHGIAAIELSEAHANRAARSSNDQHWREAFDHGAAMLTLVNQDDWRYPLYSLAEATIHVAFALNSRDLGRMREAIRRLQRTRTLVKTSSGIFGTTSAWLTHLCLRTYGLTEDVSDLEESIMNGHMFMKSGQTRREERVRAFTSLSEACRARFVLGRDDSDVRHSAAAADLALQSAQTAQELTEVHAARGPAFRALFARSGDREHLEQALQSYRMAIELCGDDPTDTATKARLLDNYANGLATRHEAFGDLADLRYAIELNRQALRILTDDSNKTARLPMARNLGHSLLQLAQRTGKITMLSEAQSELQSVVSGAGHDDDLRARANLDLAAIELEIAARSSGSKQINALERAVDWFDGARHCLDRPRALPTAHELQYLAYVAEIAQEQIGALLRLCQLDAAGRRTKWLARALIAGESAKAIVLSRELLRVQTVAPADIPEQLIDDEQQLLGNLARLESHELRRHGRDPNDYSDPLHLARLQRRAELIDQLQATWNRMAPISATAAEYVAARKGHSPDWMDKLASAGPHRLYISITWFVDPPTAGGDRRRSKLAASGRRVAVMVSGARLKAPAVAISSESADIEAAMEQFSRQFPVQAASAQRPETWHKTFVPMLSELLSKIRGIDSVVISPPQELMSLPWHLVLHRAGWKSRTGGALAVVTVPSFQLVGSQPQSAALYRWHVMSDGRELGIDDPERYLEAVSVARRVPVKPAEGPPVVIGDPLNNLNGAQAEVKAVARLLGVAPRIGADAESKYFLEALKQARIIHLAAHARLDANDPLASELSLADRNLTVGDLFGLRATAELVVLSACESATGGNLRGEAIFGLAHVLLRCGAREVVASLWRVNDEATAKLMTRFYEQRDRLGSAAALTAAMESLRVAPKWSDPYFWAGFILLSNAAHP